MNGFGHTRAAVPAPQTPQRAALTRSAARASIAVAALLLGLKGWAALATGSASMLGSLADSALDLMASVATLLAVGYAAQPADREHRFGHGKAEAVAAIVQVVLISVSAVGIAAKAVQELMLGSTMRAADAGIAVSAIAIVATLALIAWQRSVVRRTGSVAIAADSVHYQSDLVLNVAVIAALALDQYAGVTYADPLFGLAIAIWLAWSALRASSDAIDHLLDREWPEDKRLRFVAVVAGHPEVSNLHDLRTRTSGTRDFAQFHIYLPAAMTVREAHDVVERVERDLAGQFPDTELLIHIDPAGQIDEPGNPLVEEDQFARLSRPEDLPA